MIRKLSKKRTLPLLWLLATLFAVVAYRLAILPTLAVLAQHDSLARQQADAPSGVFSPQVLEQKLSYYEGMLSGYRLDSASRSDRLLSILSPLCKQQQVRLLSLPPGQKEKSGKFFLSTRIVQLEGNFHGLLRVVHALEQAGNAGRVASVRFFALEDPLGGIKALRAEVYLQQLIQTGNGRKPNVTQPD